MKIKLPGIISFLGVCILVACLSGSVYAVSEEPAEEKKIEVSENSLPDESTSAAGQEPVTADYVMPFPGMTPDHPLYFLKRLRDTVMLFLMSDPVRKVEFMLLKSDKLMGMAVILKEKGKWDLVEKTVLESNRNYYQAVENTGSLKANGADLQPHLQNNLRNAGAKHLEIISSLAEGATSEQAEKMAKAANDLTGYLETLSR